VQPLEHLSLLGRKIGDHAMQKQRGLVEQPFRRFDALTTTLRASALRSSPDIAKAVTATTGMARVGAWSFSWRTASNPEMSGSRRSSTAQS
jgi:hypothetical protein